jgi:hypothetical protein
MNSRANSVEVGENVIPRILKFNWHQVGRELTGSSLLYKGSNEK